MLKKVNGVYVGYAKAGEFWGGKTSQDYLYRSELAELEGKTVKYTDRNFTTEITLEFITRYGLRYSECSLNSKSNKINRVEGELIDINITDFVSADGILAQVFYFNPPNRFNSGMPARTHFTYNKETGIITFLLTHVDEEVIKELV